MQLEIAVAKLASGERWKSLEAPARVCQGAALLRFSRLVRKVPVVLAPALDHGSVGSPSPSWVVVVFAHTPAEEACAKPLRGSWPASPGQKSAVPAVRRLHETLLRSTLRTAAALAEADILLVTTGDVDKGRSLAETIVPRSRLQVCRQAGASFATRLASAVERAFASYDRVVVVGSDTPELDTGLLREAFSSLAPQESQGARQRAVLGPATDGGYYLLGLSCFTPAAFQDIPFGQAQVAAATLAALGRAGYAVRSLPPLADVDNAADLVALTVRLKRSARPFDRALLDIALRILAGEQLPFPARLPSPLAWPRLGDSDSRGPPAC